MGTEALKKKKKKKKSLFIYWKYILGVWRPIQKQIIIFGWIVSMNQFVFDKGVNDSESFEMIH